MDYLLILFQMLYVGVNWKFESVYGATTTAPTSATTVTAPSTVTATATAPSTSSTTGSTTPSATTTTTSASVTTTTSSVTTATTTTVSTTTSNNSLACYDCSETFKRVWEPYTSCQYYPTSAPLRSCLDMERYCKVEQVTYRDMTVSIARGCTDACYHGCYAFGFGLTRVRCTSCCREAGCNTGSMGSQHSKLDYTTFKGCFVLFLSILWKFCGF